MKINVEILGLPMISDVLGKKKLEVEISSGTVKEVLDELIRRYGKKVRDAFYDPEGNFDMSIQTALNGKSFITIDGHRNPLIKEGDTVTFMMLLAGG
jgi:molybdopterin converting factor small subunit